MAVLRGLSCSNLRATVEGVAEVVLREVANFPVAGSGSPKP